MKKANAVVAIILMLTFLAGCDVLEQARQVAMLSKCEFKLSSVDQLRLAGVNIQQVKKLSDLNMMDAAKITTAALSGGSLPLNFTLNVEARNPNATTAGMTRLDWILFIDDIQMVSGVNEQRVQIPGNGGTGILPLTIGIDLKQALKGKSGDAIANFGLNLAGAGNKPTRITLKAKPTIMVGSQTIAYPGYLTIQNEFTSN
ncbi:MAG: LEA type 2 family protein [Bacteroidales bacterium]|nr:LEA type 2 family protein [Bacteroidales bacterium]